MSFSTPGEIHAHTYECHVTDTADTCGVSDLKLCRELPSVRRNRAVVSVHATCDPPAYVWATGKAHAYTMPHAKKQVAVGYKMSN